MSRNPDRDTPLVIGLSGSLLTSRIITDGVVCYDRSIRLRKVVLTVLFSVISVLCFQRPSSRSAIQVILIALAYSERSV